MAEHEYRLYPYRWVVLAVFMLINLTIQVLWIAYAPITGPSAEYYGVTDLQIGMFSMVFMIAFIPLSIPVSWLIDTYGFKFAVGIGAILMGVFGVVRGLSGENYILALLSTIGIAAAQPFLLNAWMKVAANWFGLKERATAVGLVTLANMVGIGVGMVLSPILIQTYPLHTVQLMYGIAAAFTSALFLVFAKEKPSTPPCPPGMEERALMLDGLKHALKVKELWYFLGIIFIGLGIFNGFSTWVENIIRPRGFSPTEAGTLGAVLLVGGVIGAVVIPAISDKQQKRQKFLIAGIALAIPGLLGVTFAHSFWALLVSGFFLGFFLVSVSPIGMQYSAEVAYPTPEGTVNGLIQLFGQLSVVFVYIMEALETPNGSFTPGLMLGAGLLVICVLIATQMRDVKEPVKELSDDPVAEAI